MSFVLPHPSLRRTDSSDAIKTRVVRLQDLVTASTSVVTPIKLQHPRPAGGAVSRKRSNKSEVASPTLKRRIGDTKLIKMEGVLSVIEQEHGSSDERPLGKMECCLICRDHTWCIESVRTGFHVKLKDVEVFLDNSSQQSFVVRESATNGVTRPRTITFSASSSEECSAWTKEVRAAAEANNHPIASTTGDTVDGTAATSENGDPRPAVDRAVKRGGFVYAIPPKITHIILIRHGHYVNAHAKGISDADQVLSQMGRQQAELTGRYLEEVYHRCPSRNQQVTIYHSDLTRAVETASLIHENFSGSSSPIPSSLLREGWPGSPFAPEQTPPQFLKPRSEEENELDRQDQARMELAFNKFFADTVDDDDGSFRVIVCHANLIRFLLCRALQIPPTNVWGHFEINHCGVTRIDICQSRPLKVMTMNETGHLPHSLVTSSEDHL